jgi:integrase
MIEACRTLGRTEMREWPTNGHKGKRLVAITEFKDYHRKYTGQDLADFIHFSIHTGLRISDVAMFDIARLTPQGVKLRATKNGNWIMVPIPEWLEERLRIRARMYGPKVFRPTGTGIDAITNNWRRPLNDLWKRCGAWETKPTPHRFRHTFVRLLLEKMLVDPAITLALIATLAGDSEEMIRNHYSGWMPNQQEMISKILSASYAKFPRLG